MDRQMACWHLCFSQCILESLHLCMCVYEGFVVLKISGVGVFGEEKKCQYVTELFFPHQWYLYFPSYITPPSALDGLNLQ